ncbi:hypothetical protein C8Q80DRAFT_684343 [Daedaleopsis nitida]|nr:hypothetical protein C8Q80DRAFT_684343 [Daedaleopsis nitida]
MISMSAPSIYHSRVNQTDLFSARLTSVLEGTRSWTKSCVPRRGVHHREAVSCASGKHCLNTSRRI